MRSSRTICFALPRPNGRRVSDLNPSWRTATHFCFPLLLLLLQLRLPSDPGSRRYGFCFLSWWLTSALLSSPATPGLSGSPCRIPVCLVFSWLAFVLANNVGIVLA